MPQVVPKTEKVDLRVSLAAKRILQDAAAATNRSLSEFVLESALARAELVLPDRLRFGLNAKQWTAFLEALDAPTAPAPRLAKLLLTPSVFEDKEAPKKLTAGR